MLPPVVVPSPDGTENALNTSSPALAPRINRCLFSRWRILPRPAALQLPLWPPWTRPLTLRRRARLFFDCHLLCDPHPYASIVALAAALAAASALASRDDPAGTQTDSDGRPTAAAAVPGSAGA